MVKLKGRPRLGFLVEGSTEKKILEGTDFFQFLKANKIECVRSVTDAEGGGNLLPHKREAHIDLLIRKGATKIIILTDLEDAPCITSVKDRITENKTNLIIVIALRKIESWFLADTDAMRAYLESPDFTCDDPESIRKPYEEIKKLRMEKRGMGTSSKLTLAKAIISDHNFSIERAAAHDKCGSARYFLKTVLEHGKPERTTTP